MKLVNMQAAKTHLSRLVDEAVGGEEIVLAKAGRPMVRLTPLVKRKKRKLGILKGKIRESADCWQPDRALEAAFNDSPILPK